MLLCCLGMPGMCLHAHMRAPAHAHAQAAHTTHIHTLTQHRAHVVSSRACAHVRLNACRQYNLLCNLPWTGALLRVLATYEASSEAESVDRVRPPLFKLCGSMRALLFAHKTTHIHGCAHITQELHRAMRNCTTTDLPAATATAAQLEASQR